MDQLGATTGGPATGRPLLLRPPLLFAAAIGTGVALHLAWPLSFTSRAARWPSGVTLSMAGVALFVAAIREFNAANTPVPGNRSTAAIVRRGPYRFSRNPIYVAFALIHLGVAASFGSWWLLVTLAISISVIATSVVPREERYLEARFGATYSAYKSSVRRWL
jgi:protein-S-isoprenylcysteine O-methyltransferase Ste14